MPSNTSLVGEGIARVVAVVLREMQHAGHQPTLLVYGWSRTQMDELLSDLSVDLGAMKLVALKEPLWFRLARWRMRRASRGVRSRRQAMLESLPRHLLVWMLSGHGLFRPVAILCLALTLLATGAWFVLSQWPLWGQLLFLTGLLLLLIAVLVPRSFLAAVHRRSTKQLARRLSLLVSYEALRDQLLRLERDRLVRCANRQRVDAWWLPNIQLPEMVDLRAPVVLTVPDLVPVEFPTMWPETTNVDSLIEPTRRMVHSARRITTYSEFVRRRHVMDLYGVSGDKAVVLPHGPNDLGKYLRPRADRSQLMDQLKRKLEAANSPRNAWDWDWAASTFILAPTQNRPYKNLLNLLRAVEFLNRRRHENVRLVLTASNLGVDAGSGLVLEEWIQQVGLEASVVVLPHISTECLAHVYALAQVAISPSLFEASLPFSFSEAVSVGTPVLLARMPVTVQALGECGPVDDFLFDPLSFESIAERISFALRNRKSLLADQEAVARRYYADKSWSTVASTYIALLASTVSACAPEGSQQRTRRQRRHKPLKQAHSHE
jgi:glycosyltransferase involved in cell wall biosynthesis